MTLVGRDAELTAVLRAATGDGGWTTVIAGAAGIGKSALFEAVLAELPTPAWLLRTRSREAETGLAFAGLTDLLEPVPDEVLETLPEPQRAALTGATLRTGSGVPVEDRRAVATALRTLLVRDVSVRRSTSAGGSPAECWRARRARSVAATWAKLG